MEFVPSKLFTKIVVNAVVDDSFDEVFSGDAKFRVELKNAEDPDDLVDFNEITYFPFPHRYHLELCLPVFPNFKDDHFDLGLLKGHIDSGTARMTFGTFPEFGNETERADDNVEGVPLHRRRDDHLLHP